MAATRKMIADLPIGTDVTLKLKRGQENISIIVKTQKLEGAVGEEKELKAWGVSVRDVTRAYANDRLLDDDLGVVVTSMTPGLPAQKAELGVGDVIRSINGVPVEDLDAVLKIFDESVKKKETRVLLEVNRGRSTQTAVLKVTHAQ
jgi:S1-C subfamily serine protease